MPTFEGKYFFNYVETDDRGVRHGKEAYVEHAFDAENEEAAIGMAEEQGRNAAMKLGVWEGEPPKGKLEKLVRVIPLPEPVAANSD